MQMHLRHIRGCNCNLHLNINMQRQLHLQLHLHFSSCICVSHPPHPPDSTTGKQQGFNMCQGASTSMWEAPDQRTSQPMCHLHRKGQKQFE